MKNGDSQFRFVVLGEQSLLIQCSESLIARGHELLAVVSEDPRIISWCAEKNLPRFGDFSELHEVAQFDYLFSATNLKILPEWLLKAPRQLAINFHDGPLPRYAGINAPVWAVINGETEYGVTWHEMAAKADSGSILVSRQFAIAPDETALSLNAKCYQYGLEAFGELIQLIEEGRLQPRMMSAAERTWFGASKKPSAGALLDWSQPALELDRLIRALDFGTYYNPVALAKIDLGGRIVLARRAEIVSRNLESRPGEILDFDATSVTVRCGDKALRIVRLTDIRGEPVDIPASLRSMKLGVGSRLPLLTAHRSAEMTEKVTAMAGNEAFWRRRLQRSEPVELPFGQPAPLSSGSHRRELMLPPTASALTPDARDSTIVASVTLLIARLTGKHEFTVAYDPALFLDQPSWFDLLFERVLPLPVTVNPQIDFESFRAYMHEVVRESEEKAGHLSDLFARDSRLKRIAPSEFPVRIARVSTLDQAIAEAEAGRAVLTILIPEDGESFALVADGKRLEREDLDRLVNSLAVLQEQVMKGDARPALELEIMTADDYQQLSDFSAVGKVEYPHTGTATLHSLVERQAARTPQRVACIFEERTLSYGELNQAANRLAQLLRSEGVGTGALVGVLVSRSPEMLITLLAILKAGAAYLPLDPDYPADRLEFMMNDSGLRAVVTQRPYTHTIRSTPAIILEDIAARLASFSSDNSDVIVSPAELAYVIYTSGSTGTPKGVMVEHGNVVRFFESVDARIDTEPGVWLAVTSISFDISVLELFWTLARGFTVVLHDDSSQQRTSRSRPSSEEKLEFGLFYWNVATDQTAVENSKYRLLIEGARFADSNGFNAVWNPERHFESFGGLFPNPSVTCAALATITTRVALRAGSCVVPLHSPIRIAEEWAVVDNLSNGRVGISIAAGWAAPDFAIKPENFANARQVMFESAETVRRLWRGETLSFPGPAGDVQVRTLPRPIQRELPLWVTTAGNIETFIQAGRAGTNLLTHLLGQSIEEVAEKVAAYRRARAEAGHAGRGVVTLMLHTFVGPSEDSVEDTVRTPLKRYLKSAVFLVKAAAWQFPAFRKLSDEQGRTLDEFFDTISEEDMDALLDFAFQRYFRTSGLFGTPESCRTMIEKVRMADVDEVACLIDFGIETQTVLDHLPWLNALREASQAVVPSDTARADYSLPALMDRHHVTHLQCTPSMARILVSDVTATRGLTALRQMMVGGEAFPADLAHSLSTVVGGRLTNMYGPTESTIWSSTEEMVREGTTRISIGRPLRGESMYILDERQRALPPGVVGELVIGGAGVVRGYLGRPELTAERFPSDPFAGDHRRMYRTGDMARYLPDGRIEFLGRADHQVKLRGHRVEPGEIETLLRERVELNEVVVLLREDTPDDQRLVAYLVPAPGHEPDNTALRTWLAGRLPSFMIPSAWVSMSELPLTPNGKIDRRALPPPPIQQMRSAASREPKSETEAVVAEIWQRALGTPAVDIRANFFDIGGHSLLIIQVLKELREKFERPVQMTDLFRYTTVESLAAFLTQDTAEKTAIDRSRDRAEARRAAIRRRREN